jgi:SAM-dependent MidA family methyltransferase
LPVSLAERIKDLIRREGAITFHDWMKMALYDPSGGYYLRSDLERWGRAGDYRTSPERSALFAATFARYFAGLYDELDRPVEWTIVECGAGGGEFAAGVLDTLARQFPAVFDATHFIVYDVSEDALRRARERLAEFRDRVRCFSDWDQVSVDNGIVFSNELLDAFPVHRVVQTEQWLAEVYVNVDAKGDFSWATGALSTPRLSEFCQTYSIALNVGQITEINLEIDDWFARVASRLANGFVITVDYGAESRELYDSTLRPNGTLRGFCRHSFVDDVLAQPGECDITASVNWTQVKTAGKRLGLRVVDFGSQDKFLLDAGLLAELEYQLSRAESEAEKASLTTGAREMILPGGMASSFQVLVQRRIKEEG